MQNFNYEPNPYVILFTNYYRRYLHLPQQGFLPGQPFIFILLH